MTLHLTSLVLQASVRIERHSHNLHAIPTHLASLRKFDMSTNILSGELTPDFSTSYPNLQVLDLSEQYRENNIGFAGAIPEGLVNVPFLSTLRLAGNELAGGIPPVFGSFTQLKVLDLSNNNLSGKIPKELGKLGGKIIICLVRCILCCI